MGGVYKTEGVVLRRRQLAEADDVVVLLSPTHGRLEAVAKGLRKSKRSSAGRLEPFTQVELLIACGRTLDVISQTEIVRARPSLTTDLDRLACGLYLLELYDRLCEPETPLTVSPSRDPADASAHAERRPVLPQGDASRVFRSLVRALDELEGGATSPDLVCRRAELRLLTVLGCAPELDCCVGCGTQDGLDAYSAEAGGLLCLCCRRGDVDVEERGSFGVVRRVSTAGLRQLADLRVPQLATAAVCWTQSPQGARGEVEGVLRAHFDWHWPARMRSLQFLDRLRRPTV